MHDIFISYEHNSKTIADNIVNYLESRQIRCWYAPRDVIGDYATSICDAVEECKIFVLILNANSSKSDHCLNEVQMAYLKNEQDNGNIEIMPFRIDNAELNRAMQYYVQRKHWIDAANNSLEVAIGELYEKICSVLGIERTVAVKKEVKSERFENKYDVSAAKEKRRLMTQLAISRPFDMVAYDKVVENKSNLCVLDVGANNGAFIIDRLGTREEVSKIIGLEYDESAVRYANEHYQDKCSFYQCDVESSDFEDTLVDILDKNGVEYVDVINISMLILHLKNPAKLLKILRKYLKVGGQIVIKDIDDGLNFAYPDPDGKFERMFEICSIDHDAGFRLSGRQIYTLLINAGFKNVVMENACISTAGFDYDQKQSMFDTYFGFILTDMRTLSKANPDNKDVVDSYAWLEENFDDIEDAYYANNFLFNIGFIIFSASK